MVVELCFPLEMTFPLKLFLRIEYLESFYDELSFRKKHLHQNCSYNPEHSNIAYCNTYELSLQEYRLGFIKCKRLILFGDFKSCITAQKMKFSIKDFFSKCD